MVSIVGKNAINQLEIKKEKGLSPRVKEIHKTSRETYGSRRIAKELEATGTRCGKHKAGTLMKLAGVEAKQRKKFKATTNSKHSLPVAPNLLQRQFTVPKRLGLGGRYNLHMDDRGLVVPCYRY